MAKDPQHKTMMPDQYHWGGKDDVLWETVFDEDKFFSIHHKVHVFVLKDDITLQRVCDDPLAGAHSISYGSPDSNNVRAVILLAAPVMLSAVIHEATHIALFWERTEVRRKQRAYSWLNTHPERIPEIVSNLAGIIWYSIPEEYS